MNPFAHIAVITRNVKTLIIRSILAHRVQVRHPSLRADPTATWDYGYHDLDAIDIGRDVVVMAYAEITVHKRNRFTPYEGRLTLGDGSIITTGVNIRAAGGAISIGPKSGIGQFSVLVAAHHAIQAGTAYFNTPYDTTRSGVTIGANVWVGAHCVILPGVSIGDNAVIGAGSIVNRDVPANELWAGAPARHVRAIS